MEKNKINTFLSYLSSQPKGVAFSERKSFENKKGDSAQAQLDLLKKKFKDCKKCPLVNLGRSNIVFGQGNPQAKIMFVGEGPGRDEDLQGIPFIGRAGKLLTKIILAMGLQREDVYITNVVKCRPPQNRAPLPNESQICKANLLFTEIKIVKPKIICTLGATATQELLERPISITKIRGTFIPYKGSLVMPTFHPAYLLRNPKKKTAVWQDMQKILSHLKEATL